MIDEYCDFLVAASQLGPIALATQSVLLVSASSTFQAPFSLSIAASVRIGNLLGERNAHRAEISAKASFLFVLVIAGINRCVLLSQSFLSGSCSEDRSLIAPFSSFSGTNGVTCSITIRK